MFISYAHRGASEYAPENTMSSFYLGLEQGANGIETDIRRTKDGVLVLFHDRTLERVIGEIGGVEDYTYGELLRMRVRNSVTGREDIIVKFEDFLRYFGYRDIRFAIELKEPGTEAETLELLEKYGMREKTVITSFRFECIKAVKRLRPEYKVGFLASDFDDEALANMRDIGGEQLCPQAECITAEKVRKWHKMNYNVRAWGCCTVELMKRAYDCGVDGMTVNFPDLLLQYIAEKKSVSEDNKAKTMISIMTNNVKRSVNIMDRAPLMIKNYKRYAPDILGLQECDALAYDAVVEPMNAHGYRICGNTVAENGELSRTPILYHHDTFELLEENSAFFTHRYTNSKTFSIAVLKHKSNGRIFAVINAHFAIIIGSYPKEIGTDMEVGNHWRIGNARQIVDELTKIKGKYGDIPVFLMVDFNSTSAHDPYSILTEYFDDSLTVASEYRSQPMATFHTVGQAPADGGLPLDYIFVSKNSAQIVSCEIICDKDMIDSTDHLAVITRAEL